MNYFFVKVSSILWVFCLFLQSFFVCLESHFLALAYKGNSLLIYLKQLNLPKSGILTEASGMKQRSYETHLFL